MNLLPDYSSDEELSEQSTPKQDEEEKDTYLDIDIFAPTKSNIVPKKREREESGKHPQTIKPTKRRKLVKIRAEGSLESSSDSEDLDKEENFLERAKSRFRKDAENYNFIDNKTKGEQGKLGEQALNQVAKDLFTKLPAPKLQPKWSREKQGQSTHHTNKNSFNKLEKILTSYSKEAEDSAPKPSYSSAYREEDNKLKDHNLDPALIPDSTDWIRGHHDSSVVHVDAHALRNENWRDPYMEQKEKHDKHKKLSAKFQPSDMQKQKHHITYLASQMLKKKAGE